MVTRLVRAPFTLDFCLRKINILTKNPVPFEGADQFEFVQRDLTIYLFRYKLFLPFGLAFDHYIPKDIFLQLPSSVKPEALLHAAVLSAQSGADKLGLSQLSLDELKRQMSTTSIPDVLAERRAMAMNIHSFRQTRIEGTIRVNQNAIVVFQTPFDAGWRAFSDGRPTRTLKVDSGRSGVALKNGEHRIKLRYQPLYCMPEQSSAYCLASFFYSASGGGRGFAYSIEHAWSCPPRATVADPAFVCRGCCSLFHLPGAFPFFSNIDEDLHFDLITQYSHAQSRAASIV